LSCRVSRVIDSSCSTETIETIRHQRQQRALRYFTCLCAYSESPAGSWYCTKSITYCLWTKISAPVRSNSRPTAINHPIRGMLAFDNSGLTLSCARLSACNHSTRQRPRPVKHTVLTTIGTLTRILPNVKTSLPTMLYQPVSLTSKVAL
jgi:hypothetical protein